MKHQATGSLTISTDAIAEATAAAVVEALRPILADHNAAPPPTPLSHEEAVSVVYEALGGLLHRASVESFVEHLRTKGVALTRTQQPATESPDWFGRSSD